MPDRGVVRRGLDTGADQQTTQVSDLVPDNYAANWLGVAGMRKVMAAHIGDSLPLSPTPRPSPPPGI
ncbi:hypothetical protein ACIQPR_14710 [Streptomyces sp. NPDC091280]|uniref:hypothetical protein n=1 Tax=Streptomyces sp. NPDC091280 TaxID=3365984 RepID=UPI00382FEED2